MRISKEFLIIALGCILLFLIFMTWLNYNSIRNIYNVIDKMQQTDEIFLEWMKLKDGVIYLEWIGEVKYSMGLF